MTNFEKVMQEAVKAKLETIGEEDEANFASIICNGMDTMCRKCPISKQCEENRNEPDWTKLNEWLKQEV